jgi:hypothetical protein
VKLFGAQKKRETAKPQQFSEMMMATFDWQKHKAAISVWCHRRNSLYPRKDDFLKLMRQSLCFFKSDVRVEIIVLYCS